MALLTHTRSSFARSNARGTQDLASVVQVAGVGFDDVGAMIREQGDEFIVSGGVGSVTQDDKDVQCIGAGECADCSDTAGRACDEDVLAGKRG